MLHPTASQHNDVKTTSNARLPIANRARASDNDVHLACRRLDLDFVWRDQLRLELAAPLDGTLDALPRFVEFPLGSTQVPRKRVWLIEPPAFPRRI
jgi:hypothetical protein